jgi:hypothetical protein
MNVSCKLTGSPVAAVSLPTCNLNPASVVLAAGGNVSNTLTIQTTAASTTSSMLPSQLNIWGFGGGGAVLAGVLMLSVPTRRRRWVSLLVLLCIFVAGAIGCGGGSGGTSNSGSSSHTVTNSTPATTAGVYTFTVSGADTTNANITTSAVVTLTVQ